MEPKRSMPLMAAITLLTLSAAAFSQPAIVEFDVPGAGTATSAACGAACGTVAEAINTEGSIVGFYTDAGGLLHSFLRKPEGTFVTFDAPGTSQIGGTIAYSINDLGSIVGQYSDSNGIYHGFLRTWNGTITTIDPPGSQATSANSINLNGAIAGNYQDANGVQHAYLLTPDGNYTTFDPPDSNAGITSVGVGLGLNDQGAITGFYYDSTKTAHGFLYQPDGTIIEFDAPNATTGHHQGTFPGNISPLGVITGYFTDTNGLTHGFTRGIDGTFTVLDDPTALAAGTTSTATSINLLGAVSGIYKDANGTNHGFSISPSGTYTAFDAPDAGAAAGQGTRPLAINILGNVTGHYIDANGLNHGFTRERWIDIVPPSGTPAVSASQVTVTGAISVSECPYPALPCAQNTFQTGAQGVGLFFEALNLPAESTFRFQYTRPNQSVAFDSGPLNFGNPSFAAEYAWYQYFNVNLDVVGTWQLVLVINGQTMATAPFTVTLPTPPASGNTIAVDVAGPINAPGGALPFNYTQGTYLQGFAFRAKSPIKVTQLGFYDSNLSGTRETFANSTVGIYDLSTNTLLVSATVTASGTAKGLFRYVAISPLMLNTTDTYAVVGVTGTNYYTVGVPATDATIAAAIDYLSPAYYGADGNVQTSTLMQPNYFSSGNIFGNPPPSGTLNDFGPNFQFTAATGSETPKPGSVAPSRIRRNN